MGVKNFWCLLIYIPRCIELISELILGFGVYNTYSLIYKIILNVFLLIKERYICITYVQYIISIFTNFSNDCIESILMSYEIVPIIIWNEFQRWYLRMCTCVSIIEIKSKIFFLVLAISSSLIPIRICEFEWMFIRSFQIESENKKKYRK